MCADRGEVGSTRLDLCLSACLPVGRGVARGRGEVGLSFDRKLADRLPGCPIAQTVDQLHAHASS